MAEQAPSWADVLELVTRLDSGTYGEVDLQMPGLSLRMSTSPTAFPSVGAPPAPAPAAEPVTSASTPVSATAVEVTTPMLGTCYLRPSPDADPFVAVGDTVTAATTVAIVEVMKLMNPVTAGVGGTVVEVCAADGDLVEHGQVLFRIEPA